MHWIEKIGVKFRLPEGVKAEEFEPRHFREQTIAWWLRESKFEDTVKSMDDVYWQGEVSVWP